METTLQRLLKQTNFSSLFNACFHYDRCGQGVCHHRWSSVVQDRSDNIQSALTVCVSANFKPFRFGLRFLMAEE